MESDLAVIWLCSACTSSQGASSGSPPLASFRWLPGGGAGVPLPAQTVSGQVSRRFCAVWLAEPPPDAAPLGIHFSVLPRSSSTVKTPATRTGLWDVCIKDRHI